MCSIVDSRIDCVVDCISIDVDGLGRETALCKRETSRAEPSKLGEALQRRNDVSEIAIDDFELTVGINSPINRHDMAPVVHHVLDSDLKTLEEWIKIREMIQQSNLSCTGCG